MTRRELLTTLGTAAGSVVATRIVEAVWVGDGALAAQALPLNATAGVDRVVMLKGRTYLNGWVGYGAPPRRGGGGGRGNAATPPPEPPGPPPTAAWSKVSGPGAVTFADPKAVVTTATFSAPGEYVLKVVATTGIATAESTLAVKVELPPPATPLVPVVTRPYAITSPMWSSRMKAIITRWIPHCVTQCERTDLVQGSGSGAGGLDNFIEAGKALRGEAHGKHKGYVFSNAWVHQTVESMCLALMVDAQGDREILAAQDAMKATLERWIPIILGAQHPDGYLQTAFTLRDALGPTENYPAGGRGPWTERWQPLHRNNHEGYVSGYFIESAINHYMMTGGKDLRLYNAAKKLADCWADHIGPPPKQEWFDGHQEMEQALVRFGRFVNEVEGRPALSERGAARESKGDRYIALAKFLLDCRKNGSEYDQSHLPVVQQYEAVGHAVRAMYTYSGMADVAVETRDVDYQSAVKSLWDNIVHRKYYLTGGVGSGESSEGFGPNYSLAAERLLRDVLELRRGVLPVEDAPRLARLEVREPVRADDVQRARRQSGSRRRQLLLRQSARPACRAVSVAQRAVLRRQSLAHDPHDADVDVLEGPERDSRESLRRQPRDGGRRRRHGRRAGADDRLSVEWQGGDRREPEGGEVVRRAHPDSSARRQQSVLIARRRCPRASVRLARSE